MSENSPFVIALNETKLKVNDKLEIKNYSCKVRKEILIDRKKGEIAHGGVALAIHDSIDYVELKLNTQLQAVAAKIKYPFNHTICNLYVPGSEAITEKEFTDLIAQLGSKFLILGDLNGHAPSWGCNDTNKRGRLLESVFDSHSLVILNDNRPTLCHAASGLLYNVDLSIATPNICDELAWDVIEELHGSDHFPLLIEYVNFVNPLRPQKKRIKFNTKKANWDLFQSSLKFDEVNELLCNPSPNIDKIVDSFTASIVSAANLSISKTSPCGNHKRFYWWNDELTELSIQKKKAFKRYRAAGNIDDLRESRVLGEIQRQKMSEAKKSSFESYVSTINSFTNPREVWDKIRVLKGGTKKARSGMLRVNGRYESDPKAMCDALAEHFYQVSSNRNLNRDQRRTKSKLEKDFLGNFLVDIQAEYNEPFSEEELREVIHDLKGSSEGEDLIHNSMLKNLDEAGIKTFLKLINIVWQNGKVPQAWRSAIVVPILKPDKSPTEMDSHRGISLISCEGKVLERLVNKRLMHYLESLNLLNMNQSGFRKLRSTADNLVTLEHEIKLGFCRGHDTVAVFFDLEKAYDMTWRVVIRRELVNIGIHGKLYNYLDSFLEKRNFKVAYGGELSESKSLENGLPQGSVLSCALFNLAIDRILSSIQEPVHALMFADDLVIYFTHNNIDTTRRELQNALSRIESNAKRYGFKFSKSKTKAFLFSRKQTRRLIYPPLLLDNVALSYADSYKFLGLTLDRKLNFLGHIDYVKNKARKSMNLISALAYTDFGSDRNTLLKIHKSLVVSRMDYASFILDGASKTALLPLDRLNRMGIRKSIGAFCTTPIDSLHAESGIPPLATRRKMLGMSYLAKIMANAQHPAHLLWTQLTDHAYLFTRAGNLGKSSYLFRALIELRKIDQSDSMSEVYGRFFSAGSPWMVRNLSIDLSLSNLNKNETSESIYKEKFDILMKNNLRLGNSTQRTAVIYTDGSVIDGKTAYAFVSGDTERGGRLPDGTSIFTAEMHAINAAIVYAREKDLQKCIVCSDSLSALISLKKIYSTDQMAIKIKDNLMNFSNIDFTFVWIPSHKNIEGNERADHAAKKFTQNPSTAIEQIPITLKDFKTKIKSYYREQFKQWWREIDPATNHLRRLKPEICKYVHLYKLTRRDSVKITRLRLGHTRKTQTYLLKPGIVPICECGGNLNVKHIIVECPKYLQSRLSQNILDLNILKQDETNSYKRIIRYLRKAELYDDI